LIANAIYAIFRLMNEDEVFSHPLPPPPAGVERDVLFIRHPVPEAEGRTSEDILLRRVPRDIGARFRGAAGARGLTHAEYLSALVSLHERMRALADGGDESARGELEALGLQTVTV
jgi:hypothetical protein